MKSKRRIFIFAGIVLFIVTILGLNIWKGKIIYLVGTRIVGIALADNIINPDTLTRADFPDIPGVTQEYVDAYKLFLKAKAGDKIGHTYQQAGDAFDKIVRTTENPELKLRSLYLVTLCHFLQSEIDEAYKSGIQIIEMNKEFLKDNPVLDKRLTFLEKVVTATKEGEIKDVKTLREIISVHGKDEIDDVKETEGMIEDFSLLRERVEKLKGFKSEIKSERM